MFTVTDGQVESAYRFWYFTEMSEKPLTIYEIYSRALFTEW